jgi:hypothetical protein
VGWRDAVAVVYGEVSSVVADDGALALHHGGEREVSGGRERQERGAASGSLSG